jgi:hypothetical protein
LLARVEAEVQERQGYLLLIETSTALPYAAARRLYRSSGYHCEATIHDFYERGDHLLVFAKDLRREPRQRVQSANHIPVTA